MKRYVSGFLFFFCLTMICLLVLFWMSVKMEHMETEKVQAIETFEQPYLAEQETEEPALAHLVLNQENVHHEVVRKPYCLVSEEGYLIVYDEYFETVQLFTHMPLTELPIEEQERLMVGIWFSTMAEIFSYLESYTS